MITDDDVKRLSFDVAEEFEELDTQEDIDNAAFKQYEILQAVNPITRDKEENNNFESPEMRNIIESSFNELSDKYKLPINFKDIGEITKHLGDYSEKESEFAKLYVSKLINAVTDAARVKAVLALGYLTDRSIQLAMMRAQDPNISDLGEMVAVIREIQDWLNKLQDLRDRYNIVGSDKLLTQMSEDNKKEEKKQLSNNALNDIIAQINANAKKAREAEKETKEQ